MNKLQQPTEQELRDHFGDTLAADEAVEVIPYTTIWATKDGVLLWDSRNGYADLKPAVCETCGGRGKYRKLYTTHLSGCDVCGETSELEKSMWRYERAINVLKSVRHNLRVGGQSERVTEELKERVKSCIDEYNKTKPKDW